MTTTPQATASELRVVDGLSLPAAGTYVLDPNHTRIGFVARHLMVTKVRGSFREFTGSITVGGDVASSTAEATIQSASIDTGSPDRDAHLVSGDFLETEAHPTLSFGNARVVSHRGTKLTVVGDLTIKDVTREVTLDVELEGVAKDPWGNEKLAVTARTEIDREDFGMTWNVALETGGVLVSKKVVIEIEAQAARQA
ncbi:MAG: YceI family protein [Actinomycetes bacterium]